ncbi:hypothetical protein SISSUDRAFT_691472 [Sistotremastrum suecicum HHB10207 ss-3]|uniref:Uncharacterized protein n=1 Tax=Sistotremastrum suecicum HHB10207 ss-3 TaxID=1314776 RepID=A0A166I4L1_9AGAM|nr:hypothetical protein SISSUDRAFT_691472 [Sistotremastrum suecicum HHB10207 ss-3]
MLHAVTYLRHCRTSFSTAIITSIYSAQSTRNSSLLFAFVILWVLVFHLWCLLVSYRDNITLYLCKTRSSIPIYTTLPRFQHSLWECNFVYDVCRQHFYRMTLFRLTATKTLRFASMRSC